MNRRVAGIAAVVCCAALVPLYGESPSPDVPGVVIDHIPAATGVYIGSPSIAVLPDGRYVASHDHFGPKTTEHQEALTAIFRSQDQGKSWARVSEIRGAFWSSLFVHRDALYLLGPDRHHGNILIRRSTDGGEHWTTPTDSATGVLRGNGEYHCAPMPVLEHAGRLWRAFEWRNPPVAWGINYRAGMLSAPVDADLLNAASWTSSNFLPSDRTWNGNDMGAWLEGNAVVAPDGQLVDILRVQTRSPDEKAAIVRISPDGKTASFDPATSFVDFPGGAKKFAIRFDQQGKQYWSLASIVHDRHRAENPGSIRNTLALICSADLAHWTVQCILLYHPDTRTHGFQYVDWLFDKDDIIAVCRTAYDDGDGGAHNFHDANYLTFHRIENFRAKTMADSVPLTDLPPLEITADTVLDPATTYGPLVIKASNITVDGCGAWVVGARQGNPKDYRGVGIAGTGVSNVTLKNVNAKGWDIGLKIEQGSQWLVEDCDFSDNFHAPEAGWGEIGPHGGIVLQNVRHSTLRHNKANRVWDACHLADSDDNLVEENDFSHASNTCARLWGSSRNRFLRNDLSWGIRIAPGEVHARDSAGVLVLACSNDNYFADNDITHGGDGVFLRPSGGPSSGNVFERNDASYANNNCFEAQCPGNTYRQNKANHGSHGIWIGLSNESIVEDNEVCYNGLASGLHNAPWTYRYVPNGPQDGAGGIIVLGHCNHTICRGNKVIGNNGAGICMAINAPPTQPLRVFHWVIEHNIIRDNRWGIYMECVDWIDIAGNVLENNRDGDIIQGGVNTNVTIHPDDPKITRSPEAKLIPPAEVQRGEPISVKLGQQVVLDASGSSDPDGHPLTFRWDFNDGTNATGARVTHAFQEIGPHSAGVTVTNGCFSDLAYCSFLAYEDVAESATEGHAADWAWEQLEGRDYGWHVPRGQQASTAPVKPAADATTQVEISDDRAVRLVGDASLHLRVAPASENAIRILYPRSKDAGIPLAGKASLDFWVKMLNNNIHAWKGLMPTVVIHESPTKFCLLRPNDDPENWKGGIDWIHRTVPLRGNEVWQIEGDVPATMNWMTIEFFPWGVGAYEFWLDGLAVK